MIKFIRFISGSYTQYNEIAPSENGRGVFYLLGSIKP